MDFSFSEDQINIRDSVERIFSDLCGDQHIKELSTGTEPMHTALWSQLAESGIFGLPFSEQYGGLDMSWVELCLILELQGKSVAPMPIIGSVVEAAMTVAAADNDALKDQLLPSVIDGSKILAPVRSYSGLLESSPLVATSNAGEWTLSGRSGFVPYASQAEGYVVAAHSQSGEAFLAYCPTNQSGLSVVAQTAINDEPAGYVQFDGVSVAAENVIATGSQAEKLMAAQQHRAFVALAAVQVGALEEGLKRTAEYVSERKQFGRVLGSFQAVSQQAANAYMEIESLRSVYWRALDLIEQGADISVASRVCKYWVAQAGHLASHTILHLHGGIGQDLDYPIHRFFLWAKHCERYLGGADQQAHSIGKALLDAPRNELEQLCA